MDNDIQTKDHARSVVKDVGRRNSYEGSSIIEHGSGEPDNFLQVLIELEFRLAYSSEKLLNLNVLFIHVLAQENDLEAMGVKSNFISLEFVEKALWLDLLSVIFDSEARELESFMDSLQGDIINARQMIFSCRHLGEVFLMMEKKLNDSEESFKQFQVQFRELKMQSSKLQRTIVAFQDGTADKITLCENDKLTDAYVKSNEHMVEQQRFILRMVEKSLSREQELEKKLAEIRNGEELKLKLHYTEQVAFLMEEAAEVVWGRFIEAENAAEVLMGTSKDLIGRLQLAEFHLSGSTQRENELKSKIQNGLEHLKAKDSALQKLEGSYAELVKENAEVCSLREKVNVLEKQNKELEAQLSILREEKIADQEQFDEMEHVIESMKESVCMTETRADSAEAKVSQLTETNMELTEELNFLKGTASETEKKVGSLEKQVRDLEIQLQHAKASCEASQEQQNMLYTAIWDMETLIDDLKSKVSKAESKSQSEQEQCLILSETNSELNKELNLLKVKIESLKASLHQSKSSKVSIAKEIDVRVKLMMDMVMQLAVERERIQKQLHVSREENKNLVDQLQNIKGNAFEDSHYDVVDDGNKNDLHSYISIDDGTLQPSTEAERELTNEARQVPELS